MKVLSDYFLQKKYPHTYESKECLGCAKHIAKDQLDAAKRQFIELIDNMELPKYSYEWARKHEVHSGDGYYKGQSDTLEAIKSKLEISNEM